MKKQKIQMLVVVILLVICVVAYIFISKTQGNWIPQRMTDQMHPWEM